MSSTRNPGRVAGFLYLLLIVFGPLRLIYIPNKLFVHGNATATASNIAAHELLFRLGIVSDLVCASILIFLVLALYRLFKGVDQNLAVLVVIFGGVMPATLYFVNAVSDAGALMVVRGALSLLPPLLVQRDFSCGQSPGSTSCIQVHQAQRVGRAERSQVRLARELTGHYRRDSGGTKLFAR